MASAVEKMVGKQTRRSATAHPCAMCSPCMPLLGSQGGVLAIYLAFADDPLVLESTEPNLYMDMLDAWQVAMEDVQMAADEMRPEDLEAGSEDNMSKSSDGERSELDETEVRKGWAGWGAVGWG